MRKQLLLCLVAGLLPVFGFSQKEFTTTAALFGDLRARQIGPATMSGRISSIAVVPDNPEILYVGSATGGVWKTLSGGGLMSPVFDDHTMSIGKVAIAPSNPDIVWVGTGEPWPRNSVSVGTGIYKSTNAGSEWMHMGLDDTERIADIAIHPENPDIVYVAALGHLWDANEQRGIFKTTDGGQNWTKVLYIDEHTGGADLSLDVNNPDVLYAAMWSHRRQPWTFDSGFNGQSGLYKTTDGGQNWSTIHNGLPDETLGRMAIAVAPSNSNTLYASIESKSKDGKGLYRSSDAGANWTKVNNTFNTTVRPFYFSNLTIDPSNDSIVMKCGLNAIISESAGDQFRPIDGSVHSDIHDIWIDPANGKHIFVATDGGLYESFDRGYTFKMWMNLPLAQFYHVSVDMAQPYHVYGGLQDNGSWFAPSRKAGGIGNDAWERTFGGDGFYSFRHPENTDIIFSEYQGGNLVRYNKVTGQAKNIAPYKAADEEKLRWNWNAPVHQSPKAADRMYFGAQYLYRTNDMGDSWERISPDLTTDDPAKQRQFESGGLSIDNSTAENHCTIYAIAESPVDGNTVWVGTDDGNLQVTTDGGQTWTNQVTNVPDLPANTWVTYVEPSPHEARTAFVTFDGHRTGDMTSYLYKTTDGGQTWTSLVTDDIAGYALSVRQDLVNPDLLFLGTEFGLYISLDGGASWARFENNLPKVGVRDMVIHPRDHALVLGTHGRGVIILDDITPLRQLTPAVTENRLAFLETQPTVLRDPGAGGGWYGGSGTFTGPNPSSAAQIVYYNQRRHTFGKMYIEVYKDGELIKTLPAGKGAGLQVVTMPTAREKPKAAPTNNRSALFGSLFGPNLAAGTYDVKLIKGKDTYETTFDLVYDPDSPYTPAARAVQRETLEKLYSLSEDLAYVYQVLDQIEQQADGLEGLKRKTQEMADSVAVRAGREKERITFSGGDFYVDEEERIREEISNLYLNVSNYPGRPSDSQIQEVARLEKAMAEVQRRLEGFLATDVAPLNDRLSKTKDRSALTWDSKTDFLGSETGGGSADGGRNLRGKSDYMYQRMLGGPLGGYWHVGLLVR